MVPYRARARSPTALEQTTPMESDGFGARGGAAGDGAGDGGRRSRARHHLESSCPNAQVQPLSDDDDEDDDYVPEVAPKKKRKRMKKKKVRTTNLPDFAALSIPKPVQRLHPEFSLSEEWLRGATCDEYQLGTLGRGPKPEGASQDAVAHLIAGVADGGPGKSDPLVAQWRDIYKRELPGCPYYDDAYHML